jgi:deazaflavin-dependent oxidoreductase (nitroreductase family)
VQGSRAAAKCLAGEGEVVRAAAAVAVRGAATSASAARHTRQLTPNPRSLASDATAGEENRHRDADMNDFNQGIIEEFRANGGRVGGPFAGAPVLLLTTTGVKSGKSRTTPVVYLTDGERMVIFASKGGAPNNPGWYHNLLANPSATVEVGADTIEVDATVTAGEDRERLFGRQAERFPQFAEYARKTTRQIPVVALARRR